MKALIIAPAWVGDMVMTQALVHVLKEHKKFTTIDVFARPMLHPLLQRMPEVNNCISSSFEHGDIKLWERWQLGKTLRGLGYTHAYLIPNSLKAALIPFFAKIPTRVGWIGEQRYGFVNDIRPLYKQQLLRGMDRFAALGYDKDEVIPTVLPIPQLHVTEDRLLQTQERLGIFLSNRPILALCPGAEHQSVKRWLPHYFAEVAATQIAAGWDVWIFGGPKEQPLAAIIQEKCNNSCIDLTGKTDIGEAVDLLSLSSVVVANDSGLMHIAGALNKKVIAIYGPTPIEYAPPLTKDKSKILTINLNCSPCNARTCRFGHNNCMVNLHPAMVIEAINELG